MTAADLATALTPAERHVLEHALGWLHDEYPMYRNRFNACADTGAHAIWTGLCERGLARDVRADRGLSGGDTVFCATIEGVRALAAQPNQPKRSRKVAKLLRETIAANRTETP